MILSIIIYTNLVKITLIFLYKTIFALYIYKTIILNIFIIFLYQNFKYIIFYIQLNLFQFVKCFGLLYQNIIKFSKIFYL